MKPVGGNGIDKIIDNMALKAIDMNLSKCCGKEMVTTMELGRFIEMKCTQCGDHVYMKQYSEHYQSAAGWKEGFIFHE